MKTIINNIVQMAKFNEEKMSKTALAESEFLSLGLNTLLPGQFHASHSHSNTDKAYIVLSGHGEFILDSEITNLATMGLVLAPKGVSHGVRNTGNENLILLVVMSPPIKK